MTQQRGLLIYDLLNDPYFTEEPLHICSLVFVSIHVFHLAENLSANLLDTWIKTNTEVALQCYHIKKNL
jgi:hypothetical protein